MEPRPAQVSDLATFRVRSRRDGAQDQTGPAAATDRTEAQAIVDSLLEAIPKVDEIPAKLLQDAREFCVEQLAAALPRCIDDPAATVQLVKRVRTALRRSVPDPFLLKALADAGGVWSTPGASHWPAAWLQYLDPSRSPYLGQPSGDVAQRVVDYLGEQLAYAQLPTGGPQSRRAHVLDRVAWELQQPDVTVLLGGQRRRPTAHGYRDVAFPSLHTGPSNYPRLDLLVSLRLPENGARHDVVIAGSSRGCDDEISALHYAESIGAIALRLVPSSAPASLFSTDLVIPDSAGHPAVAP